MPEVVKLPNLGMNMQEGTFVNWVKKVGDSVKSGEVLAEIESDKATIEIEATASGTLTETLVKPGDTVTVGMPIAKISQEGGEVPDVSGSTPAQAEAKAPARQPAGNGRSAEHAPAEPTAEDETVEEMPGGIKASPIARKIAQDKGIDLRQVRGTGPGGRIVKTDVESFQPGAKAPAPASAPQPAATFRPQQLPPAGPDTSEEPISKLRQRIASRMIESKQNVPHFYVMTEIDMAPALALRKQINESLPEEQKVSVNDLLVKAVALTLRQFPNLNSSYYGDKIIRYHHINIGIAVSLEGGGLLNVVAKDADSTPLSQLAQHNKQMIASARAGKVRPEDIEGSTFTISNMGPYDVDQFIAIITPPEAAILAVGSAKEVPIVINGELKIGTRMKCTLSVDHRISDGAEGAQFLQALKKLVEAPMRMLI